MNRTDMVVQWCRRNLPMINTVALIIAFGMIGWAFSENGERIDEIQSERYANQLRSCRDINSRHDNTIARLDLLISMRMRMLSPEERVRLQESRRFTVLLIDQLTPKRDCVAVARRAVNGR